MSEVRKLVAVLVADVVGYSRLAGADMERALARHCRIEPQNLLDNRVPRRIVAEENCRQDEAGTGGNR
jgi:hypothetical protein